MSQQVDLQVRPQQRRVDVSIDGQPFTAYIWPETIKKPVLYPLRTARGTEIAEMLTTVCGNGGCSKSITRDKMLEYIEKSGGKDYPFTEEGRVLRVATVQDLAEQAKFDEGRHKQLVQARELVAVHRLPMKMVDVEYLLGGERVLFYFTSEQRVDFRGLVRDLAHQVHTRIELRQVGARDEARITADYEKCGQHCCCKQFLKVLTPISMRSAKVQKATLDPTKISGRCGRLMCCLRYEDQTYEELRKKLPKRNTRVKTEKGDAWVVDGQILTQLVLVMYDDSKREAVPMEKIIAFDQPKPALPDGRIMQSPNDRPPEMRENGPRGPGGPGGPRSAGGPNGLGGPRTPGGPARGPAGPAQGPRAPGGPTSSRSAEGGLPNAPGAEGQGQRQNQGPVPIQGQAPVQAPVQPRREMPPQDQGEFQVSVPGQRPLRRAPGPGTPPPARQQRPVPGTPAQGPVGDPLALTGPTGGDLNTGDPIDDLIADAMDETPAKTQPSEPQASVKPAPVDTPQETTASPIAEVPLTPPEEPKDQPPTPQPPQD